MSTSSSLDSLDEDPRFGRRRPESDALSNGPILPSPPIPVEPDASPATLTWRDLASTARTDYVHPNGYLYHALHRRHFRVILDPPLQDSVAHLGSITGRIINTNTDRSVEIWVSNRRIYYIDHNSRNVTTSQPPAYSPQIRNLSTVKWDKEAEYWSYVQAHPGVYQGDNGFDEEALAALLWSSSDRALFENSTAPFSWDESQTKISVLLSLKENTRTPEQLSVKIWYVAAILRTIARHRHNSHYAKSDAREYRQRGKQDTAPEYKTEGWERFGLCLCGAVSLGINIIYFKRINDVDRTRFGDGVSGIRWRRLLESLVAEWSSITVVAAVLVAGTIGFVAAPGLGIIARTAALGSVILSIICLLSSVFLIFKHQPHVQTSGQTGFRYFAWAQKGVRSKILLAALFAMPAALLVWSSLAAVMAVLAYSLQHGPGNTIATRWIISVMTGVSLGAMIIAFFFFSGVWDDSKKTTDSSGGVINVPSLPTPVPINIYYGPPMSGVRGTAMNQ